YRVLAPPPTSALFPYTTLFRSKGESVGAILQRDFAATPEEVKAIAAVLGPRGRDGALKDGQKLRILLAPGETGGQRLQPIRVMRSEEHTSELQSLAYLVCRLLL